MKNSNTTPAKGKKFVSLSFTAPLELEDPMNAQAASRGMNRSQYLCWLVQQDIDTQQRNSETLLPKIPPRIRRLGKDPAWKKIAEPEWGRAEDIFAQFKIGRTALERLAREGRIKSVEIKVKPTSRRYTRIFLIQSVREFLNELVARELTS